MPTASCPQLTYPLSHLHQSHFLPGSFYHFPRGKRRGKRGRVQQLVPQQHSGVRMVSCATAGSSQSCILYVACHAETSSTVMLIAGTPL